MPKTKISEFSATPANNTDIDSINIAEGCAPSGINDAIRELMAQLKDFQTGAVGDSFNGPVGTTTAAAGAFTTLSSTGNTTLGDASGDSVTINGTATFANANPTLSAGTANGVAYLNGSKVVTSGSALVFDGTNFGIGAATALKPLDISFAGTSGARRFLASYDDSVITIKGANASNDPEAIRITGDNIRFNTGTSGSGSEQMRLTSTGLGIGTSSPAARLSVVTASANSTAATIGGIEYGGSKRGLTIKTYQSAGGDDCGVEFNAANGLAGYGAFKFAANTTTLATLDSSGNLGLGVTPSAWFTSYGTKVFQFAASGSLYGLDVSSSDRRVVLQNNAYIISSGGENYLNTGAATKYLQNAGAHQWFNAPSGTAGNAITFTQAMTLDASGNLEIGGTFAQGRKLAVDSSTNGYTMQLLQTSAFSSGNLAGTVYSGYYDGSSITDMASIRGGKENTTSGNFAGMLAFYTRANGGSDTERARIDSSGNLLVGTTSSAYESITNGLAVVGTGAITAIGIGHVNGSGSGTKYASFNYNGSSIGSITQNGTTAVAYNTSSDYRLKNTIAPMTGALAKVALLKPVTYKWNADGSDGEGFIAHELAEVCPQAVNGEKDAVDEEGNPKYQGIDTSFLVATLTAAMQEQQAIIDSLKARLDAANL